MNYIKLFVLILIAVPQSVFAQESEFNDYFYNGELSSRHCGVNTSNFIEYLSDGGYPISKIDTLVITAPGNMWSFGKVLAVNSRWGRENEGNSHESWNFHVVSVIDSNVYDFSFNKVPLILPIDEYLNRMFIPSSPFMPYGESFRVSGHGPWFTKEDARKVLKNYRFKVLGTSNNGRQSIIHKELTLKELLNRY